jgi:hypothetical protein
MLECFAASSRRPAKNENRIEGHNINAGRQSELTSIFTLFNDHDSEAQKKLI